MRRFVDLLKATLAESGKLNFIFLQFRVEKAPVFYRSEFDSFSFCCISKIRAVIFGFKCDFS